MLVEFCAVRAAAGQFDVRNLADQPLRTEADAIGLDQPEAGIAQKIDRRRRFAEARRDEARQRSAPGITGGTGRGARFNEAPRSLTSRASGATRPPEPERPVAACYDTKAKSLAAYCAELRPITQMLVAASMVMIE